MSKHFAKKVAWINPSIKPRPNYLGGFVFKPQKEITGIVVFGNQFPLANKDVSIESILKLSDYMDAAVDYGVIVTETDGENPLLIKPSGEQIPIK